MNEDETRKPLTQWQRLKYAWCLAVSIVGIFMITDMIFRINIGDLIFSWAFFAPVVVTSYIAAPILARHLKYKR
jgi:hypothetical protein